MQPSRQYSPNLKLPSLSSLKPYLLKGALARSGPLHIDNQMIFQTKKTPVEKLLWTRPTVTARTIWASSSLNLRQNILASKNNEIALVRLRVAIRSSLRNAKSSRRTTLVSWSLRWCAESSMRKTASRIGKRRSKRCSQAKMNKSSSSDSQKKPSALWRNRFNATRRAWKYKTGSSSAITIAWKSMRHGCVWHAWCLINSLKNTWPNALKKSHREILRNMSKLPLCKSRGNLTS